MFGKKKETVIHVMHFEGISGFSQDYPCTIGTDEMNLIVKKIKPDATVTLPLSRITSCDTMTEKDFMLKYHGQATTTSKTKGIDKYYLIVNYDKGKLVFWGTSTEYRFFIDMQHKYQMSGTYTL